jgi:hypothetical protein
MSLHKKILIKMGLLFSDLLRFIINRDINKLTISTELMERRSLFIITSTINPTHNRKMAFNSDQRFDQTVKTILSIRKIVPDADIFLLDNSSLSCKQRILIVELVDKFYDFSKNRLQKYFRSYSVIGFPETMMILSVIKDIDRYAYKLIFKISGRYYLNESFNLKSFSLNKMTFRAYEHNVSTRLYSIPIGMLNIYRRQQFSALLGSLFGVSVEDVIARGINPNFVTYTPNLGIAGKIGANGEAINE